MESLQPLGENKEWRLSHLLGLNLLRVNLTVSAVREVTLVNTVVHSELTLIDITSWLLTFRVANLSQRPFPMAPDAPHIPDHVLLKWNTSHPTLSVAVALVSLELQRIYPKKQRNMVLCGFSRQLLIFFPFSICLCFSLVPYLLAY